MTILGTTPNSRYYLSWMTQRLANRAPDWTYGRRWSFSMLQQMLNVVARDIERVNRQLVEERDNMFLGLANINLMDLLYYVDLGSGMSFNLLDSLDGIPIYDPPEVYGTLSGTEYQLTMASKNNIDTFWYDVLPSRIQYGSSSANYTEVIPQSLVSDINDLTPDSLPIDGHLYITVSNNTTWEYRGRKKIYYPKVYIRGTTRKGTYLEEAVPIRYNGTFRTINQWQSIQTVFVSYMDDTAYITIESLPFSQSTELDTKNLITNKTGQESWRFVRVEDNIIGSTIVSEGFTVSDFDVIRLGFNGLDYEYKIELLDANSNNVNILASVIKPNTDYVFCVDTNKLYVYNTKLPYPDVTIMDRPSSNAKVEIWSDRWVYLRNETATVHTDIIDVSSVPMQFRWHLLEPDGTEYYLDSDGTKQSITVDTWIANDRWDNGSWTERQLEILLDQNGTYVLSLECYYADEERANRSFTLTSRFLLYTPSITPEVTLNLPTQLYNATDLGFDSDGRLWFLIDGDIYLADVFYDYFMVDYEHNRVWLREEYSSVRVVV